MSSLLSIVSSSLSVCVCVCACACACVCMHGSVCACVRARVPAINMCACCVLQVYFQTGRCLLAIANKHCPDAGMQWGHKVRELPV